MDRLPARLPPATHSPEQTQWYIVRLRDFGFGGPLSVDAFRTAIEAGTLTWTDMAYVEGSPAGTWKRIFEIEALKKFYPAAPEPERLKKFTARVAAKLANAAPDPAPLYRVGAGWFETLSAAAAKVPRVEWAAAHYWFLLLDGKEVGPVELSQIEGVSRIARIPASAFAWNVGMKRWKPLVDIPALSKYVGKASAGEAPDLSLVIERGSQKRRSSRKSVVAAVFQTRTDGPAEMIGVCGDVSPDGFQLIQYGKTVDYITGQHLDLEIRASKLSQVNSFRVRAAVKWFDPAKKIVGLEFILLDPMDRKLLEKFSATFI